MAGGQCIGHFAKRGLDDGFVIGYRHQLAGRGQIQVCLRAPAVKQRHAQDRHEIPAAAAAGKQAAQLGAGGAGRAGQHDAGEEGGAGSADAGLAGPQAQLGRAKVRAVGQQRGRQTRRQRAGEFLLIQRPGRWCINRRMADQLPDQGAGLGALAFQERQFAARAVHQGFHFAQLQIGTGAGFAALLHDAPGFFAAGERLAGQPDALVQLQRGEMGIGHQRDQAGFKGPARFVCRQVLRQRCFAQALHPPPEVDFVSDQSGVNAVFTGHLRLPGDRQVCRRTATGSGGVEFQPRAAASLLDAVQRTRFGHPGGGKLQVAVVGQRLADQRLQVRITEHLLPRKAGCRRVFIRGHARIMHRQRGIRRHPSGGHGTTGQHSG